MTLSDFFFAALTILRVFDCELVAFAAIFETRTVFWRFAAGAAFFFVATRADVFAVGVTRPALARAALDLDAAARLETLALETLAVLATLAAAFLAAWTGLAPAAAGLASLLLPEALDFEVGLVAFDGRLADFFVAFFRVDMADPLLKPSEPVQR